MEDSLENQLLHASLLCGMKPEQKPAYRLQLFFVANKHLNSKSHQSDFQRALETGVDEKGLWDNHNQKGSGHYFITTKGYQSAKHEFGSVKPEYEPILAEQFRCKLSGTVQGNAVQIHIKARRAAIFINSNRFASAKAACQFLQKNTTLTLPTKGESAVRVLCNMAIDHDFDIDLT